MSNPEETSSFGISDLHARHGTKRTITCPTLDQTRDDLYAMVCQGDCLAPRMSTGDFAIASPTAPLQAGEIALLHFKDRDPAVKVLTKVPHWLPHEQAAGSTVIPMVEVETLNPPQRYWVSLDKLTAIHAVVQVLKPSDVIEKTARPSRSKRRVRR